MFVPISHSAQPPIDTTTFYEGTLAWSLNRADPVRAYDTYSGQLIFNVYETLIAWNRERYWEFVPTLATNVPDRVTIAENFSHSLNLSDPVGSIPECVGYYDRDDDGLLSVGDSIYLQDGAVFSAWTLMGLNDLGEGVYGLNIERYTYVFHIRTSPTIDFYNESGAVVDTFDVNDARYSLQRGLVQDQVGSPQWMFYKAFFGTMNSDPFTSNVTAPTAMTLAHLIDNAVQANGTDLILNLGAPFPDNAFKQTLANTYGSIVSKEFSIDIGCWNGDLYTDSNGDEYPDWWDSGLVRRLSRSPYDVRTGSYPYVYNFRYCGTGPYHVATLDPTGRKVVLQRNPGWWQEWPISGNGNAFSNGYVDTYEIDYISSWTARRDAFIAGSLDVCNVPRAYMFELLNNATKEPDPSLSPYMKTIKSIQPSLQLDALHFTFTLNASSPYIGSGHFPDGIPLDFFNNTHVRKAFAYSFNQTQYTDQTWFGEAVRQYTPLISGLCPDYRNVTFGYDASYALAEAELKQAMFDGQSVWDTGFTTTLYYWNSGGSDRILFEMIRWFFQQLSTYDGRVGSPFTINPVVLDWATILNKFENRELPVFDIGWLADFPDADNFMRPYMHSNGDFSYLQNYTLTNGWGNTYGLNYPTLNKDELIDRAFATPDGSDRAKMYADIESIYVADCPSLPIPTPTGRRWCQYWVKGWYYDAMYPAVYIPSIYKYDDCWCDSSGPTLGVQDGVVNMRDISWLLLHWNSKAPIPGLPVDPRWIGTYGNGGVDPYGNRMCEMRDIQVAILHFNHKNNTLTP
jgi:peptide/nickel transport system substrate-binding protein